MTSAIAHADAMWYLANRCCVPLWKRYNKEPLVLGIENAVVLLLNPDGGPIIQKSGRLLKHQKTRKHRKQSLTDQSFCAQKKKDWPLTGKRPAL